MSLFLKEETQILDILPGKPKYQCELCGTKSDRPSRYKTHIDKHPGVNLSCSFASCDKLKFINKISLRLHLKRVHKVDGIFKRKNSINMTKKTYRERLPLLKVSKNLSTTSKNKKAQKLIPTKRTVLYECCECNLSFIYNSSLWEHLSAKHADKLRNSKKIIKKEKSANSQL